MIVGESVLEFREEVKWYLSFTNEEVFQGMALSKKEAKKSLEDPCFCRHPQGALCARASSGRESPEVFGLGEGIASIPTSGGCQGDPPTYEDLEAKGRI